MRTIQERYRIFAPYFQQIPRISRAEMQKEPSPARGRRRQMKVISERPPGVHYVGN
jgi:hypothetical protein